jgi:hypothetical protein
MSRSASAVTSLPTANDLKAHSRNAEAVLRALVRAHVAAGIPGPRIRAAFRHRLTRILNAETMGVPDGLTRTDMRLLDALEELEKNPRRPFATTIAALAVASELRPSTVSCSLVRLESEGWLLRNPERGKGTTIVLLRRAA